MKNFTITFIMILLAGCIAYSQAEKDIISSIEFRNIGPAFMTGRIADIAKDPQNPSTWYVAVASGNVWKTTNNGTSWMPIFDRYGAFSIGCVTVDHSNPNIVWLGTGENQSQRSVGWGDGLYKSMDGGKSWRNMGLEKSEHIGKILIDPRNSDVVYVAAQGPLWKDGGDRGVYKTKDGGNNWKRVLNISKYTGIADLAFDPNNPDIVYAASYQRRRHVGILVAGGPESRIYKSTNAGEDWKMLTRGLPSGELGRIAIAVSPQKSNVLYALIAGPDRGGGFYRSEDFGESWRKMNDYIVVDPQYYGEIYCDPNQFDKVYAVDVIIHYTENGGRSFESLNTRSKHVDNHAILFDQSDPDYIMVGCDGGIYESWDLGNNWKFHSNLPVVQFYRVGLDNDFPFYHVYGGTQDNSTLYGPVWTNSRNGITNSDWKIAIGGDGFQARIDPEDPNTVYCQSQYAGIVRYDKRTGQRIDIQPQPAIDDDPLRWHWDSPLIISPHNPKRIYFAAQKLFRSDDRGDNWRAVSSDLSRGENRNNREVMGRIWSPEAVWKNVFTSPYGTIVSLSESPLQEGLIVVGTDDGLIQITDDGGQNWTVFDDFTGVPEKTYVADVFCSNHKVNTVYAVFNNHKEGDFKPYILKTEDLGKTWKNITEGIEEPHACWVVYEDHISPDLLFAGTEFGIFCSVNRGENWTQMKGNLPTVAIKDIEIQKRENDLVLASFGRGFYILDDYTPLRQLATQSVASNTLFPVKNSWQFYRKGDWGSGPNGAFGNDFYSAENPPYGAVFSVYLSESFQTRRQMRKAAERKEPESTRYPDYETLLSEDFEESPELFVQIKNRSAGVISLVELRNRKGFQRVNWDFNTRIWSDDGKKSMRGPSAQNGSYTAQVMLLQIGTLRNLTDEVSFEVKTLPLSPEMEAGDREEFYTQVTQVMIEATKLNEKIEEVLQGFDNKIEMNLMAGTNPENLPEMEEQRKALKKLQYELIADQTLERRFGYYLPGILDRLRRVSRGQFGSVQITGTQRGNFAIAKNALEKLSLDFKKIVPQ